MANEEAQVEGQEAAATEEVSFLEQAISATKQTERSQAEDMLKALTKEAMSGTVKWDKNLSVTINNAIAEIDNAMSKQLAAIMHSEKFVLLDEFGMIRGFYDDDPEGMNQLMRDIKGL